MPKSILIVDDDPTQRRLLETVIGKQGYDTRLAAGGEEAIEALTGTGQTACDLMVLDLVMPRVDGIEVLRQVKPQRPDLPVIVLTAKSGVDTIVNVMRAGATDFIVKPVSPERLQVSIENALKLNELTGEISRLTRKIGGELSFDDLIVESPAMRGVMDLARRAAASNIPVLIDGESGVGKEMVARAIQGASDRAKRPFVAVNCGAIPENLVESILFGHEKGSFTGASDKHVGKFQEADSGTLFLDEIGELRPDIQVKLLRALQEGEIDPVGAKRPIKIDIRLISATNRDLFALVGEGKFREDLYYRLNVFPMSVPPLRQRPEDIVPLTQHFLARFSATEGKSVRGISEAAVKLMRGFEWPGNVRQLENMIFRAVVLCDGPELSVGDFPQLAQMMGVDPRAVASTAPAGDGGAAAAAGSTGGNGIAVTDGSGHLRRLEDVENDMIRLAIEKYDKQMSEVARRLGIGRSTLYRKVRELGIEVRAGD